MTVRELINKLLHVDMDLDVAIPDDSFEFKSITHVGIEETPWGLVCVVEG